MTGAGPEPERLRVGLVVVAAGAGRRLGGVAKALLPTGSVSFLARIVATAGRAGVAKADAVVVVGAPFAEPVAAEATRLGVAVVDNPAPERGMASSVALGFAAAAARGDLDGALLWPVDHPRVAAATVAALIAAGEGVPVHGGRGGHPVLIPRRLFAALAGCGAAPEGARSVVRGAVRRIDVDDPAVVADVDLPDHLVGADRAAWG